MALLAAARVVVFRVAAQVVEASVARVLAVPAQALVPARRHVQEFQVLGPLPVVLAARVLGLPEPVVAVLPRLVPVELPRAVAEAASAAVELLLSRRSSSAATASSST